ncbi:MAG: nitroreductase family protein [Tannerellaceae bacterium]|jgi:nitroreductase|nr:nitroreductase family protein [Tannerellaceae bacterium]
MDFEQLIRRRRSIRQFTDEPLTDNEVETILRAALMAPSSKNSTPWTFVVVSDKEKLRQLAASKTSGASFLESCVMAVVVLADSNASDAWIADASIASIYMQLQAEDIGLGSCWCHLHNRTAVDGSDSAVYVRRLLHIAEPLEILSIIAFGHKNQERRPFGDERFQWNKVMKA